MELTVAERLVLANVLPAEGNFTTLRLVRKLREDLSFDDKEHKELEFVQAGDKISWNPVKAETLMKDVEVGEIMTETIKEALKKLNDEKKLKDEHISLYEKFIGE